MQNVKALKRMETLASHRSFASDTSFFFFSSSRE
jgi:hypothetical protein